MPPPKAAAFLPASAEAGALYAALICLTKNPSRFFISGRSKFARYLMRQGVCSALCSASELYSAAGPGFWALALGFAADFWI